MAIPIYWKNYNPFSLFPFINTLFQMIQWRLLYIPSIPFYYNPAPCPRNPFLINHIFPWKSKAKLQVQILHVFCLFVCLLVLLRCKNVTNKTQKVLFESVLCNQSNIQVGDFCNKKLTAYNRKQFPPEMFERVLNNTYSSFDETYFPK